MLYVTTSRKPSVATRKLARAIATLAGGECENRGKRSVQEAVERAQARGFKRLALVYENHGNPSEVLFLEKENWLGRIVINSVVFPSEKPASRVPQGAVPGGVADGEKGRAILELFGVKERKAAVSIHASQNELSFTVNGEPWGPLVKLGGVEVGAVD